MTYDIIDVVVFLGLLIISIVFTRCVLGINTMIKHMKIQSELLILVAKKLGASNEEVVETIEHLQK
jgi:hypothetical protein